MERLQAAQTVQSCAGGGAGRAPGTVPQPGAHLRVLVIDDEYGARLQVELALLASDRARVVGEASNGMRGAELAEELQPDIIVLDLSMPVMDGFEALPLLRTVAPRSVVLVRSSLDDEGIEQRVRALGARVFIPKFLPLDDLLAAIEAAAPRSIVMPAPQGIPRR